MLNRLRHTIFHAREAARAAAVGGTWGAIIFGMSYYHVRGCRLEGDHYRVRAEVLIRIMDLTSGMLAKMQNQPRPDSVELRRFVREDLVPQFGDWIELLVDPERQQEVLDRRLH